MTKPGLTKDVELTAAEPRPWVAPLVEELPPLRELTLQTGGGIPGGFFLAQGTTPRSKDA